MEKIYTQTNFRLLENAWKDVDEESGEVKAFSHLLKKSSIFPLLIVGLHGGIILMAMILSINLSISYASSMDGFFVIQSGMSLFIFMMLLDLLNFIKILIANKALLQK